MSFHYLARQSDFDSDDPNDICRYSYVAIVDFGSFQQRVSRAELAVTINTIASFMREECYIIIRHNLVRLGENSHTAMLFSIFEKPEEYDAFVGIASVFFNRRDAGFLTPIYRQISPGVPSRRYAFIESIQSVLESLRRDVLKNAIHEFPNAKPRSKAKTSVIPNGSLLMGRIEKHGSYSGLIFSLGKSLKIDSKTFQRALAFSPISKKTFEEISKKLDIKNGDLKLQEVSFREDMVRSVGKCLIDRSSEIREAYDLDIERFLMLVEDGKWVPEDKARFFFGLVTGCSCKACKGLQMKDLISSAKTGNDETFEI